MIGPASGCRGARGGRPEVRTDPVTDLVTRVRGHHETRSRHPGQRSPRDEIRRRTAGCQRFVSHGTGGLFFACMEKCAWSPWGLGDCPPGCLSAVPRSVQEHISSKYRYGVSRTIENRILECSNSMVGPG